jgi:hypothetical protein
VKSKEEATKWASRSAAVFCAKVMGDAEFDIRPLYEMSDFV